MAHWFYSFLCSWISFQSLYLDNNQPISFFIVWATKNSLDFMIKSVSCLRLLSTPKWIFFLVLLLLSLLLLMIIPIFMTTCLNCCEVFCWYKRYIICLISYFSFYKLFPAFICVNNTESLVNSLLCNVSLLF